MLQLLWIDYIPRYVKATVIGGFPARKHCEVGISKEAWNDQLPVSSDNFGRPAPVRAQSSIIEDRQTENARLLKAAKLRRANRNRKVKDILK